MKQRIGAYRLVRPAVAVACAAGLAAAATAPADAATPPGAMWHLDETSPGAEALDSSGNANHGTLRGDVVTGLAGHLGTAYSFETPGAWVEVPTHATLNPGTRNFAFSAWVNFSVAPGTGVTYDIVRKGLSATAGGEYKLEIINGGRVKCEAKDSARRRVVITGPRVSLADSQWHQIGCARVGSSWRVIIDGKVKSKSVTLGSVSNSKSLSIGSKYGQEDGTPGLVDQVQLTIG
jgi:hypothetical protein